MLSNLETEKSKLIQVVLAGQPQLRDLLARPSLEQLRQRVTVHYHLRPMGPDETAAYINHRLRRASIGPPLMFSADVTDLIYRYSLGVARKVNIMADAMLLFGYGANRRVIDLPHAQEVLRELGCDGECPAPVVAASEPQAGACTLPLRPARQVAAARPASSEELAVIPSRREADDGPEYESRFEVLEPGASNVLGLFQPCYRVLEDPARTTTFWARMRRGFMGVPVFED
jgi:hypothetical protein